MNVFELVAKLGLDTSEYDKGLEQAGKTGQSFGSKVGGVLKGAGKAAAIGIGAATTAVVGFAKASIDTGKEFDVSMSQIAATLGLTVDDIENNVNGAGDTFTSLRDKAKEMGAATNFTASQAADGLNILAMSGYDANESMSMIEDVLHLAAAGAMDMGSAAKYVSGTMKGFNDKSKTSGYYANLMAKGATLANTNVQQLGEAMSSGAAGAQAYGQSADSMTISLLRLAEQGEVGAAAGTALSAAMKNIYSPTTQAKKALKELGVAAYDSSGKSRDFNTVVNELDAALAGYTDEQKAAYKQTIFGIQGLDAFNKMTVTGIETQEEWAEALGHASDGIGEAAKQYNTMTDNLQGDLDILGSAFDGLKIALSDKLTPAFRQFVQFASGAISDLTRAFEEDGLNGAMDALGHIISDGIALILESLPGFVDAGMKLLGAIIEGLIANLPQLITAVGEIGNTLYNTLSTYLMEKAPGLWEFLGGLITTAQTVFNDLISIINDVFAGDWQSAWEGILTLLTDLFTGLGDWFWDIFTAVAEIIKGINWVEVGTTIWNGIKNVFLTVATWFADKFQQVWDAIKSIDWADLGQKILDFIGDKWEDLKSWASKIWENAKDGIQSIKWDQVGENIWKAINGAFSGVVTWFQKLFMDAAAKIMSIKWEDVGAQVWTWVSNAFTAIGTWFHDKFSGAKDEVEGINWTGLGESIWNAITAAFAAIVNYYKGLFMNAAAGIMSIKWTDVGEQLWTWIKNAFLSIGQWFYDKFFGAKGDVEGIDWAGLGRSMFELIVAIFFSIGGVLKGLFKLAWEDIKGINWKQLGKDIWDFIVKGIGDLVKWFGDKFGEAITAITGLNWSDLGSGIWSFFTDAVGGAISKVESLISKIKEFLGFNGKSVSVTVNQKTTVTGAGGGFGGNVTKYTKNARAMDRGHIFRNPTVFAYDEGAYQIAGDVGPEAVVGVSSLNSMIQESVNRAIGQTQTAILAVLSEILQSMPNGELVLDTGALVGGIAPEMNAELSRIAAWNGGGHA